MTGNSLDGSRVLLVEDNADDEALTVRALRKLDPTCIVDVARDGQQAVDYLAAAVWEVVSIRFPDLVS